MRKLFILSILLLIPSILLAKFKYNQYMIDNGFCYYSDNVSTATYATTLGGNTSSYFQNQIDALEVSTGTIEGQMDTLLTDSTGWAVTNETDDRVYNSTSTTINELSNVLGTLIEALKTKGLLGS